MDTPLPTNALLASFHSGRWVLSHIPASGIKLLNLASKVANTFSMRLVFTTSPLGSSIKRASAPSASDLALIFSSKS